MRCRQPLSSSSSDESDGSDIESCFDIEDEQEETDADTDLMDVDTGVEEGNEADIADLAWIAGEDNAYPPEYYLDQEEEFDGFEVVNEDYKDNSVLLLNGIEERWNR